MHASDADQPTPGSLWRAALRSLCETLERRGATPASAIELGETVILICALQHVPIDLDDAVRTALNEAHRQRAFG